MTINWNLYEKKLKMNGDNLRDRQINDMKNLFLNNYKDNPSFRLAYFNGSTISTDIWIIDTNVYGIKTILSLPDETFNIGDVVVYDSLTYLVITIDEDNIIQTRGQIQLCNNTLLILKNNILHHIPCIIESNVRFQDLRIREGKFINIPDDKITARIPNNEITKDISRNLIFKLNDYDNYKIISVNRVTEPGLIILKMEFVAEEAIEHNFAVEILNGDSIEISQFQLLTINIQVTDNGEIVSSPALSYSSSDETIAIINESGVVTILGIGTVTFSVCLASDESVSDSIVVEVVEDVEEQHNITYSLSSTSSPDTEIKQNQSKTYVAQKYDNGSVVSQTFSFSVVGDTSSYEMTVVNGNECSIKALKANYNIVLKAVDNSDVSKFVEKNISLKALF